MRVWFRRFDNWCLKRKLWKAAEMLIGCKSYLPETERCRCDVLDSIYETMWHIDHPEE